MARAERGVGDSHHVAHSIVNKEDLALAGGWVLGLVAGLAPLIAAISQEAPGTVVLPYTAYAVIFALITRRKSKMS